MGTVKCFLSTKAKGLILLLLFSNVLFSNSVVSANKNLVLHVLDFEAGNLNGWSVERLPHAHSAGIVEKPVRSGKYSVKFVLNESDKAVTNGKRAELTLDEFAKLGGEYWYGFSIFLPEDWKQDSQKEIVAQWHGKRDKELSEKSYCPVLAIRIKKEKWYITSCWDSNRVTLDNKFSKTKLWKGNYQKGVWTDWVVHTKWSYGDDGLTEIWKDGEKIVNKKGPNAFNDKVGPYFKIGIYKSVWNKPGNSSDVKKRVVFFDEIRVGGKDASYEQVAPH